MEQKSILRTKIIATIGPACSTPESISELVQNGVSAARINFSHGTVESHLEVIKNIRAAEKITQRPISIILDTKGAEIRIGKFATSEGTLIKCDDLITILTTSDDYHNVLCTNKLLTISFDITDTLKVGSKILVDDGGLILISKHVEPGKIIAKAFNSYHLVANKRVNLPSTAYSMPFLSERDIADIRFGVKHGVDYVAASFLSTPEDAKLLRQLLIDLKAPHIKIIAKIESALGVSNIKSITSIVDGCMVARGDLSLEIPYYKVPYYQKEIIKYGHIMGKLTIVATQMLESMIINPSPTRAEVTDVYYATELGVDATMLSGETAVGKYSVGSVHVMSTIIHHAEREFYKQHYYQHHLNTPCVIHTQYPEHSAIALALFKKAATAKYKYVVVAGGDSRLITALGQVRPNIAILFATNNLKVYRAFGVEHAIFANWAEDPQVFSDPKSAELQKLMLKYSAKPGTKILHINGDGVISEVLITNI